jgi:hypothetical protein
METITKIIRAKDKYKTLEIPKEFVTMMLRLLLNQLIQKKVTLMKKLL